MAGAFIEFPKWKLHWYNEKYLYWNNTKIRAKTIRNASSNFIAKKNVKEYIFNRDNNKCVKCGSEENLQIDHIISVYKVINNEYPLDKLNIEENLQTLCKRCNIEKGWQ